MNAIIAPRQHRPRQRPAWIAHFFAHRRNQFQPRERKCNCDQKFTEKFQVGIILATVKCVADPPRKINQQTHATSTNSGTYVPTPPAFLQALRSAR